MGKTDIAHQFALREGYDVLSADAMLVYQGMDIGTAKPTSRQREEIRYFGIDLAEPRQSFSVADYLKRVTVQLAEAQPPPRSPLLVVGGTGLYLKTLTQGLENGPAPDYGQRAAWEEKARRNGAGALRDELRRRAPRLLDALSDRDNPRRLIRALERHTAGCSVAPRSWRGDSQPAPWIGLRTDAETMRFRISERTQAMVSAGLWEEAARLAANAFPGRTALQAIGYAEALAHLRGEITEKAAVEQIMARTRRLAKRQMTWLRHQGWVEWITLDSQTSIADIMAILSATWDRHGSIPLKLPENNL